MTQLSLGNRLWLTSPQLVKLYGLTASHNNASRVAQRIVKDYNLPWYRDGKKWRTSDPSVFAMIQQEPR